MCRSSQKKGKANNPESLPYRFHIWQRLQSCETVSLECLTPLPFFLSLHPTSLSHWFCFSWEHWVTLIHPHVTVHRTCTHTLPTYNQMYVRMVGVDHGWISWELSPMVLVVNKLPANMGDIRLRPLGQEGPQPGEGNGNTVQYSLPENPMRNLAG